MLSATTPAATITTAAPARQVLVFNKADVTPADFAMEWMEDFEKFQEALDEAREET